jgi:hypothetical protein
MDDLERDIADVPNEPLRWRLLKTIASHDEARDAVQRQLGQVLTYDLFSKAVALCEAILQSQSDLAKDLEVESREAPDADCAPDLDEDETRRLSVSGEEFEARDEECIVADDIAAVRNLSGLRSLRPEENELPLSELPGGVYGFTIPWGVERIVEAISRDGDLDLRESARGTIVAEIHKRPSASLAIAGYISDREQILIREDATREPVRVVLYLEDQSARRAISIPTRIIQFVREREIDGSAVLDLDVSC